MRSNPSVVQGNAWHRGRCRTYEGCLSHRPSKGAAQAEKLLEAFERSLAASYIGVYLQTGGQLPADKFHTSCGFVTSDIVSMVKRTEV